MVAYMDDPRQQSEENVPMENLETMSIEQLAEMVSDATTSVRKAIERQGYLRRILDKKLKNVMERAQQIDSRYSDIINPSEGESVMKEEGISRGERY